LGKVEQTRHGLTSKLELSDALVLVPYLLVGLAILWKVLLTPGTIGFARDWPFPPYSVQYLQWAGSDLSLFSDVGGGTINVFRFNYPLTAILGSFSLLGWSGDTLSKATVLALLPGAGFSMFLLSRVLGLGRHGAFVGGLFYMMTPDVFGRLNEGHLSYLVSYSIAPVALALYSTYLRSKSTRALLLGALVYSLAWAQGQFVFLLPILFLAYSAFTSKSFRQFGTGVGSLALFSGVGILLHNPWPVLLSGYSLPVGVAPTQLSQSLSLPLIDALRLRGYTTLASPFDGIIAATGGSPLVIVGFLPAVICSLGAILRPKGRTTLCFLSVGILSLALATGALSFLGDVYSGSMSIPFFSLFRDPEHFLFLVAVSYAVLMAEATSTIIEGAESFFQRRIRRSPVVFPRARIRLGLKLFPTLFLTVLILSWSLPFFTSNVGGALQAYDPGDYRAAASHFLGAQEGYFHIAWLPLGSVGTAKNSHISPSRDPSIGLSPKPAIDPDTIVWQPYYAFLSMTSASNTTKYLAKLLGIANVKYVLTQNDFTPYGLKVSDGKALVAGQEGLQLATSFGDIGVFTNNEYLPAMFSTNDSVLVSGDRSALVTLSYLSQRQNRSLPLVFFASDMSSDTLSLLDLVNKVVITGNDYFDLVTPFLPNNYEIDSGIFAEHTDPNYGWTYVGRAWSAGWYLTTPIEPVAVTDKPDTLRIPFAVDASTTYESWARVYVSPRASYVNFTVDNRQVASVVTKSSFERGYEWVRSGPFDLQRGDHEIEATSGPGENILGRVVTVPTQSFQSAFNRMIDRLHGKRIEILLKPEQTVAENSLLSDTQLWGKETSQGIALEALSSLRTDLPIWVPFAGDYGLQIRSNNSTLQEQVIDDFHTIGDWRVFGQGTLSLDNSYTMQASNSLHYSFLINKTSGGTHFLYKAFASQDWGKYDTMSFWIFPKITVSPAYVVVAARTSSGDWLSAYYYARANEWNHIQLDISSWNRTGIDQLRLVMVGDAWGPYIDGQQVDLFLDGLALLQLHGEGSFAWTQRSLLHLDAGYNSLPLVFPGQGAAFDIVSVESDDGSTQDITTAPGIGSTFSRVSPTKYELSMNSGPSFVFQAINYDSNWVSSEGRNVLAHFKAFGSFNAYWVPNPSARSIVVQFPLEGINDLGNALVLTTFTVISILILDPTQVMRRLVGKR
jgi:hypothetical protein